MGIVGVVLVLGCANLVHTVASDAERDWVSEWIGARPIVVDGLENVFEIVPGVFSGSSPYQSSGGVEALAAMGVVTLLNVDGAEPNVSMLAAHGIRSVHYPIRYKGLDDEQKLVLAKAMRDLIRPIYVHCHHGRHRGPVAAAAGLVGAGELSGEEAMAFLGMAQTSHAYPGLWRSVVEVGEAGAYMPEMLDGFDVKFVEVARVKGLASTMAGIDQSWWAIGAIRNAGWRVPAAHPDLEPVAEAGMIHNLLRGLQDEPSVEAHGTDFTAALSEAIAAASSLEDAIVEGDTTSSERWYVELGASCKSCHVEFRNVDNSLGG